MTASRVDRGIRELAAKQFGVFAARQIRRFGATKEIVERRVRREEWEVVGDGVYRLVGALSSWRQRLQIALLIAGPGAVISHRAAAALWRMAGFKEGPIEILAAHGRTHHRLENGIVHESRRLPRHHIRIVDGLPVTSPERTICDLATLPRHEVHPLRLERAVHNALSSRLVASERLWSVWGDLVSRGRPGVRVLRTILVALVPGYVAPESELEERFLELLRRAGTELPIRQLNVGGEAWIGRVDFAYRAQRLIIEVDGRVGHHSDLDRARDRQRDNELQAAGWRVLRFTWEDVVTRPQWVLRTVEAALSVAA